MSGTKPVDDWSGRPTAAYSASLKDALLQGVDIASLDTSEAILVVNGVDDSYSIQEFGNTQVMIEGCNALAEALRDARAARTILLATVFFNEGVIHPLVPLRDVPVITESDYRPSGATPLYRTTHGLLLATREIVTTFTRAGINASGHICIASDGANQDWTNDEDPNGVRASHVYSLVREMEQTEYFKVMAVGIPGGGVDFRTIFTQEMGIKSSNVLLPGDGAKAMRKAYGTVSQSAIQGPEGRGEVTAGSFGR